VSESTVSALLRTVSFCKSKLGIFIRDSKDLRLALQNGWVKLGKGDSCFVITDTGRDKLERES
jgi:hypothetical protein